MERTVLMREGETRRHRNNLRTAWLLFDRADRWRLVEAAEQMWGRRWWDEIHEPVERC